MTNISTSLSQLPRAAQTLHDAGKGFKLWLFDGDLGVGKTTLIQQLGLILKIRESITSPTFSLVQKYHDSAGNMYSHFDCYRLETLVELLDLGFEDYIFESRYCFVEWACRIDFDYFEIPYCAISIERRDEQRCRITFRRHLTT